MANIPFLNNAYFAGKVGIGNASATKELEIGTNAVAETELRMHSDVSGKYFNIQSAGNFTSVKTAGSQNFILDSSGTSGYLTFVTNASERMRINYNGRVGIGTTSPASKLHVAGSSNEQIKLVGSTGRVSINSASNSLEMYAWGNGVNIYSTQTDSVFFGRDAGVSNKFYYYDSSNVSTMLVNTATGRVGIGTTSPQEKLDISAGNIRLDDNQRISWSSSDSNIGRVRITGNEPGNFIAIATNNSDRVRINDTGVGIGTTSPQYNLDIQSESPAIRIKDISDNNSFLVGADNGGAYLGTFTFDALRFLTDSSEKMRIKQNGNVGIGTNNPSTRLHVDGDIRQEGSTYSVSITGGASVTGDNHLDIAANASYLNLRSPNNSIFYRASSDHVFKDAGGSNEYLRIKTSGTTAGNVGIGTTSPSNKLTIGQAVDDNGLKILGYDDESGSSVSLSVSSAGHARLSQTTDGSSGYLFLQAENYLQLIAGTFTYTTSTFRVYDNTQLQFGNSGDYKIYYSTSADNLYIHTDDNKGINVSNTGGVQFNTYGAGTLVTDASGNITVSSGGGAGGPYLPLAGGTMSGDTNHSDNVKDKYGTGDDFQIWHDGTNSRIYNDTGDLYIRNSSDNKNIYLQSDNGSGGIASYLTLDGSTTHAYFSNPGNVGIGTTSPSKKLDVNGQTQFYEYTGAHLTNQATSNFNFNTLANNASSTNGGSVGAYIKLTGTPPGATGRWSAFRARAYGENAKGNTDDMINFFAEYRNYTSTNAVTLSHHAGLKVNSLGVGGLATVTNNYGVYLNPGTAATNNYGVYQLGTGVKNFFQGNVGIVTTAPTYALDVTGSIRASVQGRFGNGSASAPGYSFHADSDTGMYRATTNTLAFSTSGSERMRITSDGKVGIGTTSPNTKLHISGGIIQVNDGTGITYYEGDKINSYNVSGYTIIGRDGLTLSTVSADKDIILSPTGNVGIGTTSPSEDFEVSGDISIKNKNGANPTDAGSLYFKEAGSDWGTNMYGFRIHSEGNLNILKFQGASTTFIKDILTLTRDTGRVGIGTNSPSEKLHITGNARVTGAYYDSNNSPGTSGQILSSTVTGTDWVSGSGLPGGPYLPLAGGTMTGDTKRGDNIYSYWGNSDDLAIYHLNGASSIYDRGAGNLNIFTNGGSIGLRKDSGENMLIANIDGSVDLYYDNSKKLETSNTGVSVTGNGIFTGNVGIGTTNPSNELEILGGGSPRISLRTTSETVGEALELGFQVGTSANSSTNSVGIIKSVITQASPSALKGDMVFQTNSGDSVNTKMVIKDSGNVGIGTTNPTSTLHVNGGTGALSTGLTFGDGDTGIWEASDDNLRFSTVSSTRMIITSAGNVGIGTTSPTSKLFITAADGEMVDTYMVNILNQELTAGDNFGVQIRAGLNTSDVSLNVANKDGSSLFRVRGDGNVGIGTTNPGNKLSIQGSQATVYNSTDSGGQAFAGTTINNTNTAGNTNNFSQLLFTIGTNNNSVSRIVAIRSGSDASDLAFVGESAAGVAEYMRIKSGGNVGIGTTSPSQKLEVVGNIQATGTRSISSSFDANHYMRIESNSSGGILKGTDGGVITTLVRTYGDSYFNGGNVGIGTTSPGVKLDVNGQIRSNNEFLLQTGTTAIGSIRNQAGALDIRGDSTRDVSLGSVTSPQALFIEGSNGNVGIGTTSPNAKLNVNGNIKIEGTNSLSFGGSASIPSWAINSSGNDLIINDQATTSGDVLFTNDGSVGIGTTSPSQKLDVNGVVQSDRFFVGTNTAPSQWAVQVRNNNSTADSGIYFNNNSSEIYLRNSSNVIGARIRSNSASYFNGGDVGIGTASPQERLHVSGETHPSIKLSSSSDGNYNVILNCGYRNEALNLSVGGYKVFTTEGFNTPETTHLYSNNSKALSLASNQAATFTSTVTATNFINSSDERLKENIEEVRDNNVEVNWKTFNFKTEKEQKRYGVIAQELEKTNPEFVREDSQGFKSVAYIDLLIAKIAELEARIQKLEK